jgi:hypothetical protein
MTDIWTHTARCGWGRFQSVAFWAAYTLNFIRTGSLFCMPSTRRDKPRAAFGSGEHDRRHTEALHLPYHRSPGRIRSIHPSGIVE